jgi:hypothetical protein
VPRKRRHFGRRGKHPSCVEVPARTKASLDPRVAAYLLFATSGFAVTAARRGVAAQTARSALARRGLASKRFMLQISAVRQPQPQLDQ